MSIESKHEPLGPGRRPLPEGVRPHGPLKARDEATNGDPHTSDDVSTALEDFEPNGPERQSAWGRWVFLAVLLAAGSLLFLPVQFPSSIRTYGRIQCAHEWVLVHGVNGELSANTFNHETGVSEGYHASSFDRSASVYFTLNPGMIPGRAIARGDTVGIVSSSEVQERLVALNGELAAAERLLAVNTSGEKAIVVQAAEQRLDIAKRRKLEQERSFERSKALYSQGLMPQGQYESAENSMRAAEDEVAMATTALETARTGAKPEQVQLVSSNITALKDEIAALRSRAATHTIVSPLTGLVTRSTTPEVLLTVSDTSRYVAMIPVRLADIARVASIPEAEVTFRGFTTPLHGRIAAMDHQVTAIGLERVVMATAVLDRSRVPLVVGLPLRCDITCPPMTAMMLVKQFLFSLVS